MGTKNTRKTAYYLRAKKDNKPVDLEGLIVGARKIKPTVADSEIQLGEGDIVRIQPNTGSTTGRYAHLAFRFTECR